MQVKRLRQSLQVVLCVNQVLDRHLAQSEEFNEVSVTDAFQVLPIQVCISQVLQELLELGQVDRADDFFDICVHHLAPVNTALSRLEIEFWRKWHQMAKS